MTGMSGDDLLSLLPALYRLRDADQGGVLGELVDVFAGQIRVLQADLDGLYDDQFIETCADWVAPYIGDLIGYRPMVGATASVSSPRADVADTIRNRRRKGTGLMLEELARDVTGWPAHETEYFLHVVWAQFMNHLRPDAAATPDLRNHETVAMTAGSPADAYGGAFDHAARCVDVRRITTAAGHRPTPDAVGGPGAARPAVRSIGVVLWRIASRAMTAVPVVQVDALRFRVDPLGRDLPLFAADTPGPDRRAVGPLNVPAPLGRRFLADHLDACYGPGSDLLLERLDATGRAPVDVGEVLVSDLSDLAGGWAHQPPPGSIALDPVLGRIQLGEPLAAGTTLLASWYYGEAVPAGAGSRERGDDPQASVTVALGADLQPGLDAVAGGGTVVIADSWTYPGTPTVRASAGRVVTVRAADRERPVLSATGPVHVDIAPDGAVVLDGLLLSGGSLVVDEHADAGPRTVTLRDCTLVPGLGRGADGSPVSSGSVALHVLHPFAVVTLERCVVGPIVAVEGATVTLVDCIVDADATTAIAYTGRATPAGGGLRTVVGPADQVVGDGLVAGADLSLTTSTVIGAVHTRVLDASDCLLLAAVPPASTWPAPVWAQRRQQGCVRFSWLPPSSRTGPRFHCQPATEPGIMPTLTSTRFGDPGYGQLDVVTPDGIRRGADDGGEMGVTHGLFVPLREDNLRIRLTEYLRFGLEAGFGYAD